MPVTRKGTNTRESIITASKKSFLKYGLEANTLSDICKRSKTNLGTLTYYFPKKADIVMEIYRQYAETISAYVHKKEKGLSSKQFYYNFLMVYYYQIYSNEKVRAFHRECLNLVSMNKIFKDNRQLVMPLLVNGDNPNLDLLIRADNAIRREFNLDFINKEDFSFDAVKRLIMDIHIVNARLYENSLEDIQNLVDQAANFMNDHLDCDISLL